MRALLGALALLLVLPMGARGDGDWNDDDLPYTMATRVVSGDVLSDANLPLRLLDPSTGAVLLETNTDPLTGNVGFGPGVQRGVQAGIPNGDFSMPPPDLARPIDDTSNPLPYWTWTPPADGLTDLYVVSNSGAGSGYYLRAVPTGSPASLGTLEQLVPIPISQGQQYRTLLSVYILSSNGFDRLAYQFVAIDQTTTIGSEDSRLITGSGTPFEFKVDAGLVPPSAAFLRIRLKIGSDPQPRNLAEVRAAFPPAEATVGLYSRSTSTGAISTTETSIAYALIPANSLVAGSQYVIKAFGTLSVSGGVARTATFRLRVGPTTLTGAIIESMNPTTTTTASGDGYMIEATLTVASVGATGTVYGSIEMNGGSQPFAVGTRVDVAGSTTTIDTTVANYIELTAETSNAAATTTFRQAYIQCVMAS